MPRKCIFGCTNTGVAFHVFPSAKRFPEQFSAWVMSVGGSLNEASDYEYYKKKRVCDLHFKVTDRNRNNRLNALAVPSPVGISMDREVVTNDQDESEDPLYLDLDCEENTNDEQQYDDPLDIKLDKPQNVKIQPSTPRQPDLKKTTRDMIQTLDDHDYFSAQKKTRIMPKAQKKVVYKHYNNIKEIKTKLVIFTVEKRLSHIMFITFFLNEVVFEPRGLIPPVFTPLNEDLTINYKEIENYADYMLVNEIKAVLVGGTTGEHMSLSVNDRKKVIEAWVKTKTQRGLHIMVQVGGAPMADVIELAKFCASANVDSLLTLPELYFKPKTVTELVNYVELVSNAAPNLPILYYHIPSMSKVEINMPAFVAEATAKIPNFKGIKFTSNDLSEAAQVKRILRDDQEMFLGADTLLAPAALLGIKSSIGTSYNLYPKLALNILDAVENGDVHKANKLQQTLSQAIEAHLPEGDWVPTMKAGMEIVSGLKMGPPALPQRPISIESRNRIVGRLKLLRMV